MDARGSLIRTYSETGKTAQANTLLNKQLESLSSHEKDGSGLEHHTVLERLYMRKQLEHAGRKDDVSS